MYLKLQNVILNIQVRMQKKGNCFGVVDGEKETSLKELWQENATIIILITNNNDNNNEHFCITLTDGISQKHTTIKQKIYILIKTSNNCIDQWCKHFFINHGILNLHVFTAQYVMVCW